MDTPAGEHSTANRKEVTGNLRDARTARRSASLARIAVLVPEEALREANRNQPANAT